MILINLVTTFLYCSIGGGDVGGQGAYLSSFMTGMR